MKKRFKSAAAASFAITAAAALSMTGFISDASFALDAADEIPETEIVIDPTMVSTSDVTFAAQEEVVADIPADVVAEDAAANQSAEERAAAAQSGTTADFVDDGANSLRQLVRQQDTAGALSDELECLAGTVYFESKSESLKGQLAVAKVVLARAESSRFPASVCGVVYQRSQFSFVRNGRMPRINRGHRQWRNAVAIAKIALNDGWESPVEGALFFHAKRVSPGWKLQRMAAVDNHIFYR